MSITAIKRLAEFEPARLTQARKMKGWTMAELALRTDITRQAISSFERLEGGTKPAAETLRLLANKLDVEPSFLTSPLRPEEQEHAVRSAITWRTLASSTKRDREQGRVFLQWLAGLCGFVEQYVDFQEPVVPDFGITDFLSLNDEAIEDLAAKARRFLGLGDGPISNLTLLLENKGMLIGYVGLAANMDGLSAWIQRPTILVSNKAYAARARYDLAHEYGHIILHRALTTEDLERKEIHKRVEEQANYFASCFLLPEKTFSAEIYNIDEGSLIEAKKRWGVSMQAILMRLRSMDLISQHQLARAFQRISMRGQRRKEPLDGETEPERSRFLRKAVEFVSEHGAAPLSEFLDSAGYPGWFLEQATGLRREQVAPDNVLPFKLKTA